MENECLVKQRNGHAIPVVVYTGSTDDVVNESV